MTSSTNPSWAAIVVRSSAAQLVEEHDTTSHVVSELSPSGSVINVKLKAEMGWIVGQTDEPVPRRFIPSQLFYMFPHLHKRLFAHVYTRDSWPEPGGMYGYYARPGVTRKTYTFEDNTYVIDFTDLQVGDASNCPACGGPIIKQFHRFRKE